MAAEAIGSDCGPESALKVSGNCRRHAAPPEHRRRVDNFGLSGDTNYKSLLRRS